MKNLIPFILFAIICITVASCSKEKYVKASHPIIPFSAAAFQGKWSVVQDSSYTEFIGIWTGKTPNVWVYQGTPADFFNFTANGVMYSQLNNWRDTIHYRISGDTVQFRYAYYDASREMELDSAYDTGYIVTNFTGNTCTLNNSGWSPETATNTVIKLTR